MTPIAKLLAGNPRAVERVAKAAYERHEKTYADHLNKSFVPWRDLRGWVQDEYMADTRLAITAFLEALVRDGVAWVQHPSVLAGTEYTKTYLHVTLGDSET